MPRPPELMARRVPTQPRRQLWLSYKELSLSPFNLPRLPDRLPDPDAALPEQHPLLHPRRQPDQGRHLSDPRLREPEGPRHLAVAAALPSSTARSIARSSARARPDGPAAHPVRAALGPPPRARSMWSSGSFAWRESANRIFSDLHGCAERRVVVPLSSVRGPVRLVLVGLLSKATD